MRAFSSRSTVEQFAAHLREAILRGDLRGKMPGVRRLADMQGVGSNTVIAAIERLEREGYLLPQGPGKRSKIVLPDNVTPQGLRVAIMLYEPSDAARGYMVELRHALSQAGHPAHFCAKSLVDVRMDLQRLKRVVAQEQADAWVIFAGSREILEWFAAQPVPVFACGGRRRQVKIAGAGPDKLIAQKTLIDKLVALGHRRIVMLAREERRKPEPALFEQTFLDRLKAHGISTGSYNLPDWKATPAGLGECLDQCFRVTPPTALFIDEMSVFVGAQHYLAQRGILAPQHVSLVCGDPDPAFDWCRPTVAHIDWDPGVLIRRILAWAHQVALGKHRRRQYSIKTTFVNGGTVGPVPWK